MLKAENRGEEANVAPKANFRQVTPNAKIDLPADLPELAAEPPTTSPDVPAPAAPTPRTEPAPPLAPVESLPDWMNRSLAPERREQAWQAARERLGPPAISAGPDDDLGDLR
jgi:hypothetical protein